MHQPSHRIHIVTFIQILSDVFVKPNEPTSIQGRLVIILSINVKNTQIPLTPNAPGVKREYCNNVDDDYDAYDDAKADKLTFEDLQYSFVLHDIGAAYNSEKERDRCTITVGLNRVELPTLLVGRSLQPLKLDSQSLTNARTIISQEKYCE
ncbi:hypothetical protein FF38_08832 [Lucilia cuprina]|uniref:Uncharacterized protein n=1 Tax=Lucilia cuprina TaxID=7375 RepID=A0A0L0BRU5_LUCCU|nr:hypothetical protein FF38_08832 [Lucilia cuprina]